jgi:ribosomal protein S27E
MLPDVITCPICGTLISSANVKSETSKLHIFATNDPDNVFKGQGFSVRHVSCENCGYVMLFDPKFI